MVDFVKARQGLRRLSAYITTLAIAISASGCARDQWRMNAQFNAEPFGPPPQHPAPSPPADDFLWLVRQPLRSTLVHDLRGGGRVRIEPLQGFLADPDRFRQVMIAFSDTFSTNRPVNMRGKLRIQINGDGDLFFVIRAVQGGRITNMIGGGTVDGVLGRPGSIRIGRQVTDAFFDFGVAPLPGDEIAPYHNGRSVILFWSIDQSNHFFRLSAEGGSDGHEFTLANAPIEQLMIILWMHHPHPGMVAHVDDITMEELD